MAGRGSFNIHFDLRDKEVREALQIAPQKVVAGINKSLMRSAVHGVGRYRRNMPVGATGELRKSTKFHFQSKVKVTVEPTAPQAEWVESGTKPHWTSVKNLEKWARMKGINPYALQRSIAKHGTKAHPFQDKTYEQIDRFATADMKRELNTTVKEIL